MKRDINEKKKKYAIVITFLVLMICITGGTYAYFALTASNNSVTGSVGGASLNLEVTKVYPTSEHNSKNMIPQLESTLDEAISLEHKCVDGNGNVICQVYSATVTNVGSTSSVLNGTISFTGIENMPNLKWMRINDSNTIGTYSSSIVSTDKVLFEEEKSFGANTSNTYYFVFWIDETGEVQTDSGDFRANIEFDSSTGGLTSTVRPPFDTLCKYQNNGVAEKTAGAKYSCEVTPGTSYSFYVLTTPEDGAETINLIMDRNICEDGTLAEEGKICDVYWQSSGNNADGPVTAMNYLYNATKGWTNISPLNYIYNDREVQNSESAVGYTSFVSSNGVAVITPLSGDGVIIGSETEPLRTRMPIEYESNQTEFNDDSYLFDNLDPDGNAAPYGYWTLSTVSANIFNDAWYFGYGVLGGWVVGVHQSDVGFMSGDGIGVRPVITLEM